MKFTTVELNDLNPPHTEHDTTVRNKKTLIRSNLISDRLSDVDTEGFVSERSERENNME